MNQDQIKGGIKGAVGKTQEGLDKRRTGINEQVSKGHATLVAGPQDDSKDASKDVKRGTEKH